MKRKDFLKTLGASLIGAATSPLAAAESGSAAPATSPAKKRARTLIYIFLAGGPSHTDTFDPKPAAGRNICGNYTKPIQTSVGDLLLNEHLPELAKIADKYSVIRSMTHNSNAHEVGQYVMYTGDMSKGKIVYPSIGAVLSYLNPMDYKGALPPYINLFRSATRFNEGGFLGSVFKPLDTIGKPDAAFFEVEGIVNSRVSDEELQFKRELLAAISAEQQEHMQLNEEVQKLEALQKSNFELLLGDSRKVFDLSQESKETRAKYGMNDFGQSCLAARRLAEYGVPVIGITYGGWDTHKEHFKRMNQRLGTLDKGVASLIADLDEKGILDETIVLCGGEFGRTPVVMWEPPWNGGRNHFGRAFSFLVAGGGFARGAVLGKTDATSENVAERPVYPADLFGSIYELMGIDPHMKLPHALFGDLPLLPSLEKEGQHAGLLHELYTPPARV